MNRSVSMAHGITRAFFQADVFLKFSLTDAAIRGYLYRPQFVTTTAAAFTGSVPMCGSRVLLALLLPIWLAGCARYGQISGLAQHDQKNFYRDGRQTLSSEKNHTVAISPLSEKILSGARGDFIVAVLNGGAKEILFSTSDIVVSMPGTKDTAETSQLKVYSYEELVAEERRRQAWAAAAVALQSAGDSMSAANAGYSNTSGSYSGSTYSNYGTTTQTYGTYTGTSYNYAAAQAAQNAAQARTNANIAQLQTQARTNLGALASMLKKETIFPGELRGGIVRIQMPAVKDSPTEIIVNISIDGEIHSFRFVQTKAE